MLIYSSLEFPSICLTRSNASMNRKLVVGCRGVCLLASYNRWVITTGCPERFIRDASDFNFDFDEANIQKRQGKVLYTKKGKERERERGGGEGLELALRLCCLDPGAWVRFVFFWRVPVQYEDWFVIGSPENVSTWCLPPSPTPPLLRIRFKIDWLELSVIQIEWISGEELVRHFAINGTPFSHQTKNATSISPLIHLL